MKKNFINRKDSNKNLLSSPTRRFKQLYSKIYKKHGDILHLVKEYFQTTKSEIDFYFKYSPRLRRRHSIEGSHIYIPNPAPPIKIKRTNTIVDHKKIFKLVRLEYLNKECGITAEKMNQKLMEKPDYINIEQRIKFLTSLNPFYDDFSRFDRHSEAIIAAISPEYKGAVYPGNHIIFRYGDELNNFYLIHKGKVNIYCPFTESVYMTMEEYYVYLLRLRRYNEIEMLNNVLLMNNNIFLRDVEDQFNFDKYILKLYNTYIKLKFSPDYLTKKENKKNNNSKSHFFENKNANNGTIYINQSEYNEIMYKSFKDKDMKHLVMRIENELIETMMYIYPEEMKQVIKEEDADGEIVKQIIKISEYIIEQSKTIIPDEVKSDINNDYIKRIAPIKIHNTELQKLRVTIMRYALIKTLSKGEYFGESMLDSNDYFYPKLLNNIKKSKLNLKLHQYESFYNVTAISVKDSNIINDRDYLYLGLIRKEYYNQYFRKFIERMEYSKRRFLLNNRLFKNDMNENLIKTYSKCFRKRVLKENECLINEKDILTEDNTFIYFIVQGEFQSVSNQTVESMDKLLISLNCEKQLKETIPVKLNKIKDTFFFEQICKRELKIKLSYLTQNDIIGLTEKIYKNKYFNSVYCISKEGIVYYVDSRIIKLFTEGSRNIRENRNSILIDKYKVLSDLLLKQRKSYLDSFCSFQIDYVQKKENTLNTHIIKQDNLLKSKKSFMKSMGFNTTKNSNLKIRNKVLNEPEKRYTSLSSVCDVLTKVYRGVSFEIRRKEKSLLFRKNYILKNRKQNRNKRTNSKELDMAIDLLQEIENQKTSFICFKKQKITPMKSLKSQKSCINLMVNYNLNKSNKILNSQKYSNFLLLKNFFKDNKNKENKKNDNTTSKNQNSDLIPLNYDLLWNEKSINKKNISCTNLIKGNIFLKNLGEKNKKINSIRLKKLKMMQENRKEIVNKKLRNIYYSDLDKILLSEQINNNKNH